MTITALTQIAGVVGRPVAHSLSPLLHNAWLAAAGKDGVYLAFSPDESRFSGFINGLRGCVICGVNVTLPFKERALEVADVADEAASAAGAANLLLFHPNGQIEARNTDGVGLLYAFADQAPMFHVEQGPVVILGAGGAARGAASAIHAAGCPELRIVNRTKSRAEALAHAYGGRAYGLDTATRAFDGARAIINATSAGLVGAYALDWPLDAAPQDTVLMDMTYKPLATPLIKAAQARGLHTVDGLAMLIGQARPSFEALFGVSVPASVDARNLLLTALASQT